MTATTRAKIEKLIDDIVSCADAADGGKLDARMLARRLVLVARRTRALQSCASCDHCDKSEAVTSAMGRRFVGLCTKSGNVHNGDLVLEWFGRGCPDYSKGE